MTWPVRIAMGMAVLAALAIGQTVDARLPVEHVDERSFAHNAGVGDPVHLTYADVTVDAVHTARNLDSVQGNVGTPGRWLVVDVTAVARGRPLGAPGISLEDARGRSFCVDPRSGYVWETSPTGVRWRVRVPFEVPEDALRGATLVFSRSANDDRRDDVARIDLGIGPDDAAALWDSQQTIEIPPAQMAAS